MIYEVEEAPTSSLVVTQASARKVSGQLLLHHNTSVFGHVLVRQSVESLQSRLLEVFDIVLRQLRGRVRTWIGPHRHRSRERSLTYTHLYALPSSSIHSLHPQVVPLFSCGNSMARVPHRPWRVQSSRSSNGLLGASSPTIKLRNQR